jgi:hypothetical protein
MTLYKLAVRIDRDLSGAKEYFSSKEMAGFGVRECAGDNEHWHFYVETTIKPNSLRVLIKRACPTLVGNGAYSVSDVRDVDKYLRYIAKGESSGVMPEVVYQCGLLWTTEKIKELHDDYWTENKEFKKRRTCGVMDFVLDRCRDEGIAWDDRTAIAEEYIKELVNRNKPINIFSIKSCVNLIQVKLCPTDAAIKQLSEQIHI